MMDVTDGMEHPDVDTLSAHLDGDLAADARTRVDAHLAACAACRASRSRLAALVASVGALPRDLAPPPDVWQSVRARVAAERLPRTPSRWWHNGWLASAAAIILVVGTALLVTGRGKGAPAPSDVATHASAPLPAVLVAIDGNYREPLAELRRTLEVNRATLAPATIRVLEHSIAVCDTALAEARAALAADPANRGLVDMVAAQYEFKLNLLQRATKLTRAT